MASALVPLANLTLGSAQASVSISSISGAYRDLILVITGQVSSGSTYILCQANGSGSFIYPGVYMSGNGSSATSSTFGDNHWHLSGDTDLTSSGYLNSVTHIMGYSATDKHKTALTRANNAAVDTVAIANRFGSTSAITSLVFYCGNFNNWAAGSTFALYGVSA